MNNLYTQEELQAAFDKVADRWDWRNKINAWVSPTANLDLIREAVIHFTATVPTFTHDIGYSNWILVTADGYYLGPAGDH